VLLTALFWGLWGFFLKFATSYISPLSIFAYQFVGSLLIIIIALLTQWSKFDFNAKGVSYALLAGLFGGIGGLFFLYAMKHGKASVVMSSANVIYPIVTIVLAVLFLREMITLREGIGIFLALSAIGLLATS